MNIKDLIRQSNLIESIDDPIEDQNSLNAWEWLIEWKKPTHGMILELHYRITKNFAEAHPGHYRTHNVQVGNYAPPKWNTVLYLMDDFVDKFGDTTNPLNPIDTHIWFERIHPFADGNGRTGRLLLWWQETLLGYDLTEITYAGRDGYYAWFH